MAESWSISLHRSLWYGRWDAALYDEDDVVLSGIIQCYDGESLAFWLGQWPPTLSDALALRVLLAIFQRLEDESIGFEDSVGESVDLQSWLQTELAPSYATAAWEGLNTPPSAPEGVPEPWGFSWEFLEGPEDEKPWRQAHLRLWRHGAPGNLEVRGTIAHNAVVAVEKVLADDLLLPEAEMSWLLTVLVERHWQHDGAKESGHTAKIENMARWLGSHRGKRGQWVWNLINNALRTFGSAPVWRRRRLRVCRLA